jgi:hypothetical protein
MYILNPSLFMQPTKKFTLVENNNLGEIFDPTITTSINTTLVWSSSDGYSTVTTGTTHDLSYTAPANGPRKWTITCVAGLRSISKMDMNIDKLVSIDITLLRSLSEAAAHSNASLSMSLRDLPSGLKYAYFYSDLLLTGSLSDLPSGLNDASFNSDPLLTGSLSDLPSGLTYASFSSDLLLTGSLSDLPSGLTYAYFYGDSLLTAGSVSGLTKIRDLRLYDIGWDAESVDIVLLSISDAIHADPAHFMYATPSLQIGGSNLAPGGNYVAPPESGNNSDWEWDSVKGKYKAISGKAAIWVMVHNTGHVWAVTATGGTYT